MLISTFLKIQCAVFCSYFFSPILYPVEHIPVQFILQSVIGIEVLCRKF